jgi:hypothetical protein
MSVVMLIRAVVVVQRNLIRGLTSGAVKWQRAVVVGGCQHRESLTTKDEPS